jgi:tetratricopeptide (TPR) repeat protein
MGSGPTTRKIRGHCLAVLGAVLFVSCSSGERSAVDGVLVLDEVVTLVRGEKIDTAHREISVGRNATFVARVDEDDTDFKITLTYAGAKSVVPAAVVADSGMDGQGIEIAVLDAPPGSRITLTLETAQSFDRPGKARLRVMRYDEATTADSRVAARLAAFRAWAAATGARLTGEDIRKTAFRDIDRALAHLESTEGDPALAAWGRLVRSKLNYRQFSSHKGSIADAELAERGFAALGDTRNAARARFAQGAALIEIAHDKAAKDPSAEEAALRAKQTLIALSNETALSPFERARVVNYLGVLAFNVYDLPEARARFLAAISAYEALGNRQDRLTALGNLGALANEEGDYRGAVQYFDQVVAELHRFESSSTRAILLYNAAMIDCYAGNIDRAIERFLHALELTRENKMQKNEARVLQGLGYAYWARGDTAQATILLVESLKLRRTLDDAYGLTASLGLVGALAREAGDIQKALALHREVVSLAASADVRVFGLQDLALDYQAASDYPRAIATSREALTVHVGIPKFYRRHAVQLVLADLLLTQPHPTSQAVREAAMLTQDALNAAILRADTTQEIAARRLLAQSYAARGSFGEAREEYERAITLIFKYRSAINNPELRATTLAHEQKTFRGYVDLLMRDVARRGPGKLLPVSPDEENALRVLEWARAINFDPARVSQLDAAAQARLDGLLTQMAGKRIRIASLLDRAEDVSRELEVLRLDIAQLRAEVDQLRAAASRESKVADSATALNALWPSVSPRTTQLSYALETEHAYVWVRDTSGIRATVLSATPAAISRDVAALAAAMRGRDPQRLDAVLTRLSTTLLPPAALDGDSKTLEIIAEGQIAAIPFAALSPPQESPRRLAESRSIVMIGSLFAAHARPRPTSPRPFGFVALANDTRAKDGDSAAQIFPALNNAGAEARAIAAQFQLRDPRATVKLLLGAEGSAATLERTWRSGVDVFHFATHGLADMRQPLASLLLLPALDADGASTYLTAGQVQEWRGDTDLVFLSACETAVGPTRFAEGLPGLQRAFLRAGARGVIATLWPVEDVYASQFAADFYRRYTAGMPASQALSETERAWMQLTPGIRESDLPYRRMTAWAHAYYAQ